MFLPVKKAMLSVIEGALTYQFQLLLKTPTDKIHFSLYEPSYYIEVRYDPDNQPTHWANGCILEIKESEPDSKVVEAAAAIDINGKGDPELGKYFAQQSFLSCPSIYAVKK
ncbi:DUF1007 family protein [Suttonella ornithocola]|uniref:DUF1007 family protein n=1 Tax=Suttonella ornithocola TaxID=279832 RepID=UPI003D15F69B